MSFPKPPNEPQRLAALRALNILDTAPEIAYDEIAELAAQICGCPVGYISFIDDHRRWLKAKYGLPLDIVQAPRETAVCSTTICGARHDAGPALCSQPDGRWRPPLPLLLRYAAHH
jgi:adenylate cyclase